MGMNQERVSESQWSRGFHGFNMLAEGCGLERISLRQFRNAQSSDVMIVVIGNLNGLPLNVTNHVDGGGAALIASDSTRPFENAFFAGFKFGKINSYSTQRSDTFGGMQDCPLVTNFWGHPVVAGVDQIVTNQPGFIISNRRSKIATLPPTVGKPQRTLSFIAVNETAAGGRAVAVGDQSVFTNQMIIHGNNARFANQALDWLKNDTRSKLLVIVDGEEHSPLAPDDVVVDLPPPSPGEVREALRNLPPEAMLEFANSVATVVEDENMVNDFIHDSIDSIPQSALNRFYIFLMFGIACLTFIVAYVCQRKLQSQTASDIAHKRSNQEQSDLKAIQFRERKQAAYFLLDRFCMDIAGRRFGDWPSFPTELNLGQDRSSKAIFESMTRMSVLYKSKPITFWTRRKLAHLENEVNRWREYFANQQSPAIGQNERTLPLGGT